MKDILFLLPLLLGVPSANQAEESTTTPAVNSLAAQEISGTASGSVRDIGDGRAVLIGSISDSSGAELGILRALLLSDGSLIAIATTESDRVILTGAWSELGFSAGIDSDGLEIELEASFSGSSWSGDWSLELD